MLIDGKGGPDHDRLVPRAWLSAKDDLSEVREMLQRVHRLMADRQGAIAQVLGRDRHLAPRTVPFLAAGHRRSRN
jgi:hypothetical protein